MAKIGRNEQCPCGSGKKFKYCCGPHRWEKVAQPAVAEAGAKVSLLGGVKRIQEDAAAGKVVFRELGVFFFFSTAHGDAWLLEMTDCDAVQLARRGVALPPPIDENSETIEINWSHTYRQEKGQLLLTAYLDAALLPLPAAPVRQLAAAMQRIHKSFSPEQLQKVHLPTSTDFDPAA